MKVLLLCLTVLLSTSLFAEGAMDSEALSGSYKLQKASSEYAKLYYCPEEIEITVDNVAVVLERTKGIYGYESFWTKNTGCNTKVSDIGISTTNCTRFNRKSVSFSKTDPLTIVGFIREFRNLKLYGNDEKKLIYSKNITEIPFGILGIWNKDEFKCHYEKLD